MTDLTKPVTLNPKTMTAPELARLVGMGGECVSKRLGEFTLRTGYYYRPAVGGKTASVLDVFASKLAKLRETFAMNVVGYGDRNVPVRGGDTVAQGSHYWVRVILTDKV